MQFLILWVDIDQLPPSVFGSFRIARFGLNRSQALQGGGIGSTLFAISFELRRRRFLVALRYICVGQQLIDATASNVVRIIVSYRKRRLDSLLALSRFPCGVALV